jgi:hypothetical protein
MNNLEQAARLALEAMEAALDYSVYDNHFSCRAILTAQIVALRAALAQQQAEPVVEPVTKATLKDAFFKGFHSVKLYYGDVETSVEEEWEKFMQQAEPVADDETGNPSF